MQANYGRPNAPVDVSVYLNEDLEEWGQQYVERHQKPTKMRRDRNFPPKQERKWHTSPNFY